MVIPRSPCWFVSSKAFVVILFIWSCSHSLLPQRLLGWGYDGYYTAAKGFNALLSPFSSFFPPVIWKTVWFSRCQPKVKKFTWLVLNNKILTGDNLSKRGFSGPFRCCLCKIIVEIADHLLIECDFSRQVWELVPQGFIGTFPSHSPTTALYATWHDRRPSKKNSAVLHTH